MPRKKTKFILEEAEVDDEEDGETDSNDELDHPAEWNEPEYWQDEDSHIVPFADSKSDTDEDPCASAAYRNSHLREFFALVDIIEEQYVRNPTCPTQVPLDADNQVSNKDLRLILLGLSPRNVYRLKCKRGQETMLVMDIYRYFLQRPQSERLSLPVSSSKSSRDTRGWDVVQRFALGAFSTLPETETELQNIYGDQYEPTQWQDILHSINDQEDGGDASTILAEIEKHLSKGDPSSPDVLESTHPSLPRNQLLCGQVDYSAAAHLLQPLPKAPVYSAFTAPSVLGWIYLEATIDSDFQGWLCKRLDVVHTSTGNVVLEVVEQVEVAQLLSSSCPSIEPFTWIRVTKGLYRHDIGLVLARESSLGGRRLKVLLVPRLRSNRKRKSRSPQGLFNPINFYRSDYTVLGHCRYQYQGDVFDHGLIELIVDYASVTYTDVEPDQATRLYFAQSGHSIYRKYPMPAPRSWVFFYGDRVKVRCSEPLIGTDWKDKPTHGGKTYEKMGQVICVEVHRCRVEFDDEADVWVDIRDLRKVIRTGDFLEVVGGAHIGRSASVLDVVGDVADAVLADRVDRNQTTILSLHVNMCRVTQKHLNAAVPWIDEHVAIVKGMYGSYTGTVVDVHIPKPFTVVDVYIPQLRQTVKIRHDYLIHTLSNRPLNHVHPLSVSQQAFRQSDWDLQPAPNIPNEPRASDAVGYNPVDQQFRASTPPSPWWGVEVFIIKGEWKGQGFVKNVERRTPDKSRSGVMVLVELQRWSASSGANPCVQVDYDFLRDPRSGLGLNEAYPLRGQQRYYEPRFRASPVDPIKLKLPVPPPPPSSPLLRPSTPPISPEETMTDVGAWNPSAPLPPVWPLLPELAGKEFLATYRSREGAGTYALQKGVEIKPHLLLQKVQVWTGREYVFVQPEDILPCQDKIDPTRTRKAMLAISGEHIGKYIRPITNKYTLEGKAVFTAKTFSNWGRADETLLDEWIEIAPEHLARISDDPNEKRWSPMMRIARDAAAKPKPPRKKR
ncbi:hypothetical protein K435DRAFT_869993 [Dendrothele bispora CBS 962.96]|uniref:Chromatin elongation factor spt5 n=1 Tax=Dendrothele bispora (strain CBS 962.96) TaxID=1314807 RepID=A0A4V4HCY2_DENBC|nr:hypothetical protein K435DRAFT_869993 [Dendrothele bispora CBS 962.96]